MKSKWYQHEEDGLFFESPEEAKRYRKLSQYLDKRAFAYYEVEERLGDFELQYGKYAGRAFKDIRPGELYLYLEHLIKECRKKGQIPDTFPIRILLKYFKLSLDDFGDGS